MDYILVAETENDDPMELPLEEDGTLLLTTVDAQFPGSSGIKFTNPKTGASRGVRLSNGRFHPPEKEGWGETTFYAVFPKDGKRKAEDNSGPAAKVMKLKPKCTDLIVLGLPWVTTDSDLKNYFQDKFGQVTMAQVKMNRNGKSRGFGFVRFAEYEAQKQVLKSRHQIDGRWCDVSLPPSAKAGSPKIFVGRLTNAIQVKDLKQYFGTIGDVTDCFIPNPFRGFGFVTFLDPEVARVACKMGEHDINGVMVHVESAAPKPNQSQSGSQQQSNGQFNRGGGGGGGGGGGRDRGQNRNSGYEEDWRFSNRAFGGGGGGGGGGGRGGDMGRSYQGNGGGGGNRGFNDSSRGNVGGGVGGGIDLRGVSPSILMSAIKDAGLDNVLDIKGRISSGSGGGGGGSAGGGGYRGYVSTRDRDDDLDDGPMNGGGFNRSNYGGGMSNSRMYENKSPSAPATSSWATYDRYNR